jgi:hypothetical protein
MAGIFTYQKDIWDESLRKIGFYLGKYIYILDAYDDLEKDKKNSSYNPLLSISDGETFKEDCRNMLTLMMAECTREFEKLPCILDVDILRNILYDGVWTKFDAINSKREKQEGNNI